MLIAFQLSMPNNNAWNGKWTGEGRCYARVRSYTKHQPWMDKSSYYYNFGDGWGASVAVKKVDAATARKLRKDTVGFCGYDWMIDSIVRHGKIKVDELVRAAST